MLVDSQSKLTAVNGALFADRELFEDQQMQLYTLDEVEQLQKDIPYLIETVEWVKNFLAKPHPALGRTGPVCPFVPRSLQLNTIQLKVIHAKKLEQEQIEEVVSSYRDIFLEIEPREGEVALNKALLLIFPDIQLEDTFKLIDEVQQKLKPFFVEAGLMLGEFHKRNESPGLRNPDFRPLRSPIPMLAIRFMVESDLPFLQRLSDEPQVRIKYLEAYLQRLGTVLKDESKLKDAHEALALARIQLEQESLTSLSAQRQQLPVEWHQTQADYPQDACIHQLVEAQVERTPDAVAVVLEDQQLTYRELNTRANQLAHHLQALGVGPEVLVGLCVKRSIEMVVGLLGILKAGGAYVPLDPDYPQERLALMLSDAEVQVLLTQKTLVTRLPESRADVVCLDSDWGTISLESEENTISDVTSNNLAYVIYTSGSTGQPKGVMIEHRSICNLLCWRQTAFPLTDTDRVLQTISFSFDPSVWQIFWPLLFGARLLLARLGGHQDSAYLVKLINAQQITVIALVPSMLRVLLEEKELPECKSLRHVTCGGEALPIELVERFFARLNLDSVLHNFYGPTEASIDTTFWTCKRGSDRQTAPIGRPIANTQIYLLDSQLQPVMVGEPGELHIGGICLARGYLNRPDLSAQKFIPNPFSDQPNARLYKTGDLARYLPDGNIEFLGRIDHQVKIRGFRIELAEIEAVLSQHPAVQEIVVIAREEVPGNQRLVAYVVPQPQPATTISELRRFLQQQLPEYMVPSTFVLLDALPLTPNGKVNRRALPTPESSHRTLETSFVPPRTPTEQMLAAIWAEVLGLEKVGVYDNFFELGGHSLLAARLLAAIEKAFHKNFLLATIFQNPTLEQMASFLDHSEWSTSCPSMVPIQLGGGSQPPLFCIHVLGRRLEFYRPLVSYLERSQPVYGLSTHLLEPQQAPPNRVEDLAAYYIKEMRTLQPQGPYFLAGVSFGGMVAFEMAQQLSMQGQKVALLALLDTFSPDAIKSLPMRKQMFHWSDLLRLIHINVLLEKVKGKLRNIIENWQEKIKGINCKFYLSIGRPLPIYLQDFAYEKANEQASGNYRPQVYPGRITLFKALMNPALDPELGWGGLAAGGLELHHVPGTHLEMLGEPHVQVLGEKFKACLEQAQADAL